jgi:DksA/TraR C4-type zinc finger protein
VILCRTFREEPLARLMCFPGGALYCLSARDSPREGSRDPALWESGRGSRSGQTRDEFRTKHVTIFDKLSTNWNDTAPPHLARAPFSTEALTDLIYEGLAEPRLFGLGRGSRFAEFEGTYGICAYCGEDIDPKRLEALPTATRCILCAA